MLGSIFSSHLKIKFLDKKPTQDCDFEIQVDEDMQQEVAIKDIMKTDLLFMPQLPMR